MEEPQPGTIDDAIGGDEDAFAALVRPLELPVWRFLVRMLGDAALAEDVAQETFIRVYRKLGTFRRGSRFSTWVFQIARNAAIDAIRHRDRRHRLADRAAERTPTRVEPSEWEVELEAAVFELPPRLREPFVLIDVAGLTYREAGEVLGIPEGTVKSRVFHARQRLTAWIRAGDDAL